MEKAKTALFVIQVHLKMFKFTISKRRLLSFVAVIKTHQKRKEGSIIQFPLRQMICV